MSIFLKRIISTAIALSLLIAPITSVSRVYAIGADVNGSGQDGSNNLGGTTGTASGGVSVNKTGVIFYCINSETGKPFERASLSGEGHGDAFCLTYSKPSVAYEEVKTKIGTVELANDGESVKSNVFFGNRLGNSDYNMPKLFTYENGSFNANYSEWNDWFENRPVVADGKTYENMANYIVAYAFPDAWNEVIKAGKGEIESANISLIAEPVAWHSLFKNSSGNSSDGKTYFLTPSGWAEVKMKDCGNKYTFTDKFDRGALAWSMILEYCQFGWLEGSAATEKSGLIENEDIRYKWYGINIYNIDDMVTTHTIKTPTPSPAEVKSLTATNLSVIKVYESINPETQELITDGTFITTDCYSNLSINSEDTWEIISAETLSPLITSVGSIEPYDTITQGKTKKQEFDVQNLPVNVTLSPPSFFYIKKKTPVETGVRYEPTNVRSAKLKKSNAEISYQLNN